VIKSIFLILIPHVHHNIETVVPEVTIEEPIHYEHLENDVDEAESFTEPVPEGVVVVLLEIQKFW